MSTTTTKPDGDTNTEEGNRDGCATPKPWGHELWKHLHDEHGLILVESEVQAIVELARPLVEDSRARRRAELVERNRGLVQALADADKEIDSLRKHPVRAEVFARFGLQVLTELIEGEGWVPDADWLLETLDEAQEMGILGMRPAREGDGVDETVAQVWEILYPQGEADESTRDPVPDWSQSVPDKEGLWWLWQEGAAEPITVDVVADGGSGELYVPGFQHGWNLNRNVVHDDFQDAWWRWCPVPAVPGEDAFAMAEGTPAAPLTVVDGGLPVPTALYSCRFCAEDYSWRAGDLHWSAVDKGWVCLECWDSEGMGAKGIALQAELARRQGEADKSVRAPERDIRKWVVRYLEDFSGLARSAWDQGLRDEADRYTGLIYAFVQGFEFRGDEVVPTMEETKPPEAGKSAPAPARALGGLSLGQWNALQHVTAQWQRIPAGIHTKTIDELVRRQLIEYRFREGQEGVRAAPLCDGEWRLMQPIEEKGGASE